jgi:hemerythrin-like domain-containing protein
MTLEEIEMIATTHPVTQLVQEHRVIETVLTAMEKQVAQFGKQPFPAQFFEQALDFFANFADGCHHYKEEIALFPMLKLHGVPEENGPIGCMLHDHDFGRKCLGAVRSNLQAAEAGSSDAVNAVAQNATAYIQMLRQHIYKEDNVLFRMAEHILTGENADSLEAQFSKATTPERHRYYRDLAEGLAKA